VWAVPHAPGSDAMTINIGGAVETEESRCPHCHEKLDAATGVDTEKDGEPVRPVPGNISVCSYCGALLQYGADLRLQAMSEKEMRRFQALAPRQYAMALDLGRFFRTVRVKH
jgi:uncharacterized protein with PIN domain